MGLCKFTYLHGDLYLQYSVTQKKLYIKSKTPCPIRFLTTGQYLFVVVHVFSLFVHVLVIFDSWGAKDSESPPTEDGFDLHRIFSRPGHNFSVKPAGPLFLMKRPLWVFIFALIYLIPGPPPSGAFIRAMPVFRQPEHAKDVVRCCRNHTEEYSGKNNNKKLLRAHHDLKLKIKDTIFLARGNCWHGATLPLASLKNDFWGVDSEPGTTNWRRFAKLFCLPWIKSLH